MSGEEKVTKKSCILDILKSSFEGGDFSIFNNHLDEGGLCQEDLNSLYLKLGEYVHKALDYLPQQEDNISNVLQSLTSLIQSHRLTDTNLAANLAKTALLVITEEACSILNLKRAINVFNMLIQNTEVLYAIMDDASIEGSLQILGRRVPATGDYECQALMFEAMYRVTSNENREYWTNIWFSDTIAKNMFMNLDPQRFESNCRKVLNYINRNEPNKRVFSFIASSVSFGSYQLSEPCGSELWVDFNYDSQSISFYSSEINFNESADNSEMWETILISDTSVKSYTVIERKSEKSNEVVLLLNSPCHTLITSSNISNPAFNSYKLSIVVWDILDIHEHLEIVFGKDKYLHTELTSPDVTEAEKEMPIDEYMHKELTSPDVTEAEKEISIALPNDVPSLRKVSNLSAPIPVDAFKNEDIIPGTDRNLDVAVYWKISKTIETIPISSEILSEDIQSQKLKKISASSEVVQIETSEVYEGVCKKRKSSMSVDTISCDLNNDVLQKSSEKQEIPEVRTCSKRKVSYSACLKVEKEENYIHTQKRKKKKIRTRKKQPLKISPSSSGSLKIIDDRSNLKKHGESVFNESTPNNYNKSRKKQSLKISPSSGSLMIIDDRSNLKEHGESVLNESLPNNYNKSAITKSPIFTSQMNNFVSFELKKNVHDVISSKDEDIEGALVVDSFDTCKSDQAPKIDNKVNNKSNISSNSPSFVAETLNEKTICFSKNVQSDHKSRSESYISPLTSQNRVSSIKKLEKVEGTNNKNQEREKETSTSSKETDNSENTSKGNNRKVRLYNLESAPVYDVPPLVSTNDPITQDPTSCKPISNIYQENSTSNLEQRANSSELKDRQKNRSVTQKSYTTQKRRSTSVEDTVKKTVKDKKIKLFTDPSESDDDFKKTGKRNSNKRGKGKCFMTSTATNKQNSKRKRKLDEYNFDDSGSIKGKPAKRPRTAAVRARRKTKEILDPSFAIACDKIEVMNESYVERQTTSMENRSKASSKKSLKNNTDTETQSSEVSWMKQKKQSFEPPKRTYAHWSARKRNLLEEHKRLGKARADIDKSLDKQIIPESKSTLKEPPCKKKKKVTAVRSESCGLSDLENYDFVIEKKDTQKYRVLNALASDFQSISTNFPSINSIKKKLHSYSDTCLYDVDSNCNDDYKQQSEAVAEIVANDKHITNDLTKISHVTSGKHSTSSNFEKSSGVERNPNKDCNHSNISNDNVRVDDIVDNQNCFNVEEQITSPVVDKIIQEEKDEETENISSKHSLEDIEATSRELDETEKKKLAKYLQEIKGRHFILQRFLKSVNEYSGTQSDSIITYESQSEINLSSSQDKKALHHAEHSQNSEFSGEGNSLSTLHPPSEKEVPKNQNNKMKNKASESSECEAKVKKPKILPSAEKLGKKDNSAIENNSSERINLQHSRVYAKSVNDPTTSRNVATQKSLGKAMSEKIVPISKEYDGSESSFKKHKHFKQLKRFNDHSFSSIHSKLTSPSVAFSEKDKKWFDTITLALFQDANILSRKLLATVQKCFSEFINKMNILRDNIINTSNEIEMPSSQNASKNELTHLVSNCKIIRLEVEKSLRRMHEVGKQYFEAEERHFKKVKRKHIKASRKFISKMRGAQQNSIRMMEEKVLLKTKFHLKKILKNIMSV